MRSFWEEAALIAFRSLNESSTLRPSVRTKKAALMADALWRERDRRRGEPFGDSGRHLVPFGAGE